MLHWFSPPGMPANIDVDGTVVITNTALHTTVRIWDDNPRGSGGTAAGIGFKYIQNGQSVASIENVAELFKKLRGISIKF